MVGWNSSTLSTLRIISLCFLMMLPIVIHSESALMEIGPYKSPEISSSRAIDSRIKKIGFSLRVKKQLIYNAQFRKVVTIIEKRLNLTLDLM